MTLSQLQERLRGFRDHADIHAMRGNFHAVREAREDARRLLAAHGLQPEGWEVSW